MHLILYLECGVNLKSRLNIFRHFLLLVLLQRVKVRVLEQVQDQLSNLLDVALTESVQPFTQIPSVNGKTTKKPPSR